MIETSMEDIVSSPLEFTYTLGPQCSVKIAVTGEARNVATVQIYYINNNIYSGTMDQVMPDIQVDKLIVDDFKMKKVKFCLTIPTVEQYGNVFMNAVIKDSQGKRKFRGQIAVWQLSAEISEINGTGDEDWGQ